MTNPRRKPKEVTQQELAAILGRTTRQIRYLDAAGIPHRRVNGREKRYPLPDAVDWYYRRQYEQREEPTSLDDARRRKLVAEAEIAEYDLAEKRGDMFTGDYLDRQLRGMLHVVSAAARRLPNRWAEDVVGLDTVEAAESKLEAMADSFLEELAELDLGPLDDDEGEADATEDAS